MRRSNVVTKEQFREAMGKFATGVTVLSLFTPDRGIHGITANSVCSVSLDPLLVLACVDRRANSLPMIKQGGRFVMNILSEGQEEASRYFAGKAKSEHPPFSFTETLSGWPVLEGCVSYLDCRVVQELEAGDHTVFICAVEEVGVGDGRPLMYHGAKYVRLPALGHS